ncbi:hypothetical protein [Marinactinospora rubrisoli]|uniref:Uncharacterized protein n=1 Tax=Marinactinospora rubrisoli TaxID=2715399 RepID=A0ABW2KII0_9ACTN
MNRASSSLLCRTSSFSYTLVTRHERHTLEFRCDQFWGRVRIRVDGRTVTEARSPHLSFALTREFGFDIGTADRHRVTIEMIRRRVLAGLRPLRYRISVDGRFVTELER